MTANLDSELQAVWADGPPDLAAFLTRHPNAPADELAAVLCDDQERRWRRGDRLPAEVYLALAPALRGDPEFGPDLVFNEYLLRERLGEPPSLGELRERFPEFAVVALSHVRSSQG